MSRRRFTAEQIIGLLREAEVRLSQGRTVGQACREMGITEQTCYRWRKEYGGMKTIQVKRLNESAAGKRPSQESGGGTHPGQADFEGGA
jgi:putative transposase